jgi:flagellar hook-associated protein 2
VDGVAASITLDAGTYTTSQLVSLLQSKINGVAAFASQGIGVTVSQSGGVLTLRSNRYGSASNVKLVSGSAAGDLMLAGGAASDGVDVAGTIGGRAATGSGQYLTAQAGGDVDAIKLKITGGAVGDRGTVTYGKGVAYQLNQMLSGVLGSTGAVMGGQAAINKSISNVQKDIEKMNTRLQTIQAMYEAQFSRLDTLIAQLKQTESSLTSSLAALSSLNNLNSKK